MSGKRQNDVDMMATKSDIVKDVLADKISQEIHRETGIACSKRENTEIRVNIIKLEQLVKEYDLNNPTKEVPLYESTAKSPNKKLPSLEKLKTYKVMKADAEERRRKQDEIDERNSKRGKRKRK